MTVLDELERLPDERFFAVYEALTERGFGPLDAEVARALKFRPQAVRKLPLDKRAKRARAILQRGRNAELCYELFGTYLVKTKKELVTSFLDATGVPHADGIIEADDARPDPARVPAALADLDGRFEREDVTLYVALCAQQWPEEGRFEALWSERTGVPISPPAP